LQKNLINRIAFSDIKITKKAIFGVISDLLKMTFFSVMLCTHIKNDF